MLHKKKTIERNTSKPCTQISQYYYSCKDSKSIASPNEQNNEPSKRKTNKQTNKRSKQNKNQQQHQQKIVFHIFLVFFVFFLLVMLLLCVQVAWYTPHWILITTINIPFQFDHKFPPNALKLTIRQWIKSYESPLSADTKIIQFKPFVAILQLILVIMILKLNTLWLLSHLLSLSYQQSRLSKDEMRVLLSLSIIWNKYLFLSLSHTKLWQLSLSHTKLWQLSLSLLSNRLKLL